MINNPVFAFLDRQPVWLAAVPLYLLVTTGALFFLLRAWLGGHKDYGWRMWKHTMMWVYGVREDTVTESA